MRSVGYVLEVVKDEVPVEQSVGVDDHVVIGVNEEVLACGVV